MRRFEPRGRSWLLWRRILTAGLRAREATARVGRGAGGRRASTWATPGAWLLDHHAATPRARWRTATPALTRCGRDGGPRLQSPGPARGGRGRGAVADTVGFIGLGIMGAPMTRNLLRAGHAVVAWNRSPAPLDAACEA
ncbi:MAG: hypothetical protein FJZ92_09720, partial [Chloroflexi bacterium]|nr:hypothetical protein [Chloroflexota bacterium]